jgi:hypothetical protein
MRQKFLAEVHNRKHSPNLFFQNHFHAYPDQAFKFLTLMRIRIFFLIKVMQSATPGLQILPGSILSLHASILSVQDSPRLLFQPLKLLNFDFNVDPDPAFHSNSDSDAASKNNADPDPQACFSCLF